MNPNSFGGALPCSPQPPEQSRLHLLRCPSSGVTAEQHPGQKALNRIFQIHFPKEIDRDIISDFKSPLSRGKSRKGVTALDLLLSRQKLREGSGQPTVAVTQPSVLQERNL